MKILSLRQQAASITFAFNHDEFELQYFDELWNHCAI